MRLARDGSVMLWALMGLSSFVLLINSIAMMILHHGALTSHFTAQAQAFWMAEYGASEAVGWLVRYPITSSLPTVVVNLPGGDAQLGFPAPDAQVAGQGSFRATITPGAMFYTIDSTGQSPSGSVTRRIIRAVRVVPPTTRQVDIDLQVGNTDQIPATGGGAGYTYSGWHQWFISPYQVVWNPWLGGELEGGLGGAEWDVGEGRARVLFIKLNQPLAPGRYSMDIEAAYTPCNPTDTPPQCQGGNNEEGMTVYLSGVEQYVGDPDALITTEEFQWYQNVGNCAQVANCQEGNFSVPFSQSSPLYFDHVAGPNPIQRIVTDPALGDDLDGDGAPDDIRGHILIVPRDAYDTDSYWLSPENTAAGSLHLSNIRLRQVDIMQRRVEILGWRSDN